MSGYSSPPSGGAHSAMDRSRLMEQMKGEIAMANAQQLIQKITEKCFVKCVDPSSYSLDSRQLNCVDQCTTRFLSAWTIISNAYNEKIQRDRTGMH